MSTSTAFLTTRSISLAARALAFLSQFARAIGGFVMAIGNRGDVRLLLEMDEHGLKDIGLTRNDVLGALAQPLVKDPSKILLVRSVERRAQVRALDVAAVQAPRRTVRI
jgi:uncharacterized protein YjiS (DUF1127 family)